MNRTSLVDKVILQPYDASNWHQVIGQTIAHYKITAKLGAGGMGEVYRAHDEQLHRDVALKVLPASTFGDPAARARLLREARSAASLNHPHICTIYEVGEADGQAYIAMELVEGQTLSTRLAAAQLPAEQVLRYGTQIADALSHAHERQVIHRDLKCANVVISLDGRAKVLDFGLAKRISGEEMDDVTRSQAPLTQPGALMGTLAYMAPEQLRGEVADARSDIWALGIVLYEMSAGARPFEEQTGPALSSAILHDSPAPLPKYVPVALRAVIGRCLEKEPSRRYQRSSEVRAAIEAVQSGAATPWSAWQFRFIRGRGWVYATSALVLLTASFFAWRAWRWPASTEPLHAVALTTLSGMERSPSFSPDGNYVVFDWTDPKQDNQDIYVQLIGQGSGLRLTTNPLSDYNPVWSPDNRWIAFFRGQPPAPTGLRSRELWLIPPLGGSERKLADIRGQDFPDAVYLAWSPDSNSLIVTDSLGAGLPDALFVVSLESGEKRQLTNPQAPVIADTSPALSPDGRALVFLRRTSWGSGELQLLPLEKGFAAVGEPKRLVPADMRPDHPAWMPGGDEILFSSKGNLWRLASSGESTPTRIPYIGEDGLMPAVSRPQPGKPARLAYVHSVSDSNFWRIETSVLGAPSTSLPVMAISSSKLEYHPRFSPDGRRVAFSSGRSGESEIWVSDPDGSNASKVTSMGAQETMCPYWSPDGQFIAFSSNPEGEFDIYVVPASGGKPHRLTSHPGIDICPTFSRDGKWIYFSSVRSGDFRVWKMSAKGGDAVQVTPNQGGAGGIESPDGSSIYYHTVETISSVWRMPLSGGKPVKVIDGVIWFNFCLTERGLYYIEDHRGEKRLQFLNFSAGKTTTVARNLGKVAAGLTATPDGRTILFTRIDSLADDLMLVKNFR